MTTTTQLQHLHDHDSPQSGTVHHLLHQEVAQEAYRTYVSHGYLDGQDVQDWLDAESRVAHRHAQSNRHAQHQMGSASGR